MVIEELQTGLQELNSIERTTENATEIKITMWARGKRTFTNIQ
jgi:hypothetical protein